jgi:hypothetical protein
MGWMTRVQFLAGQRRDCFSSPLCPPTKPPSELVPGVISLGVKQLEHEADHSPQPGTKDECVWSHISIPPYIFKARFINVYRINLHDNVLS